MEIKARLEIVLLASGAVHVNGPLANKVLCYGMLESARDLVKEYDPARAKPSLVIPEPKVTPNGR